MKRKLIFSVMVFTLFMSAASLYAATLTRLGASPFYKAKDVSPQDVYTIVKTNADIAKDGFRKASCLDLYDPFLAQLKSAELEKIQIQPNDTFLWMIFKKKNKARLLRNVVWKGKKPFTAYRFVVNHRNRAHEFIFPTVCMNISLRSIKPIPQKPPEKKLPPPVVKKEPPPPPPPPVVKKNEPPYCNLKATPQQLLAGGIVSLDASGSYDPDGTIESVRFTITDQSNKTVDKVVLHKAPFTHEVAMKTEGDYTIRAHVTDDQGYELTSEQCVADVKVLKRGFLIADVGLLKQLDPATWLPIKIGYMYKIKENLAVTGLVGVAPLLSSDSDNHPASREIDHPATIGDVIFSYYLSDFFIGGGAGIFYTSEESKTDVIVDVGYQITHDDPNVSVYFQCRSGVDDLDEFSTHGRLGAGLRIRF